ncbi:MAG: transposase [Acetobacteraceae bacterium]|nr:transposase [Acetobacteraceae bacterium]MBV8523422.1 transposase [Acetobacteraceae bacterium]MBV8589994.1 transposase [Acetobacteraceae bacterium]
MHKRTRPYSRAPTARPSGSFKPAYAQPFHSSADRAGAMQSWIAMYNHHRPHSALGGKPPVSRLAHPARAAVITSVPESFPSHPFGRGGGVKPRAATAAGGLGLTPAART